MRTSFYWRLGIQVIHNRKINRFWLTLLLEGELNILFLQKTRWLGEKPKEIGMIGYKLWSTYKDRQKSRV